MPGDREVRLDVLLGVPHERADPVAGRRCRAGAAPTASRSARSATSANVAWRLLSPSKVTTSLLRWTVRPCRKIMPTVSGKSCMVDCIIVPFSPGDGRIARSVLGRRSTRRSRVNPRSSSGCHSSRAPGSPRRAGTPQSTISPRNSVCPPTLDGLAHLAVEERDRLVEDRRAGGAVVEREPVERARVEIDVDRLGELAHDRSVVLRDEVHARTHRRRSTSSWVNASRSTLTPTSFGVERELRDPVHRHAVAPLSRAGAQHVETARHLPEHAPPELVVLVRIGPGGTGRRFPAAVGMPARLATGRHAAWRRGRPRAPARPRAGRSSAAQTARLRRPDRGRRTGGDARRRARRCGHASSARGDHLVDEAARQRVGGDDALAGDHRGSAALVPTTTRQRLARAAGREHADARLGQRDHAVVGGDAAGRTAARARSRNRRRCPASTRSSAPGTARSRPHTSRPHRASRIANSEGAVPNSCEVGAGGEVVAGRR